MSLIRDHTNRSESVKQLASRVYIRRFDGAGSRVLANLDDGDAKTALSRARLDRHPPASRALYNVLLDPLEKHNRVEEEACAEIAKALDARLNAWMASHQ